MAQGGAGRGGERKLSEGDVGGPRARKINARQVRSVVFAFTYVLEVHMYMLFAVYPTTAGVQLQTCKI